MIIPVNMQQNQYLHSLYCFLILVLFIPSEESLDHSTIRQSRLLYKHDGSEATQDSMVFLALGHSSEASTRISITVLPRHHDHDHPSRNENATLSVTLNECEFQIFFCNKLESTFVCKVACMIFNTTIISFNHLFQLKEQICSAIYYNKKNKYYHPLLH